MSDETCPNCRNDAHTVGIDVCGIYDGVLYWWCYACGCRWHRWPDGDPLRERAEKYVTGGAS